MAHPYKSYDEHRHGRKVAKKRGYASGGAALSDYSAQMQAADTEFAEKARQRMGDQINVPAQTAQSRYQSRPLGRRASGGAIKKKQTGGVVKFPSTGREDLQRLRSAQGVESGRIPGTKTDNVVVGPGRNPVTGGIKRSWLTRQEERDMMPRAKGGRITGGAESGVGRLQRAKAQAKK